MAQNRARGASLEYIIENGGVIVSAVSSQNWPGEAAVDVSIINWIKNPNPMPVEFVLDGERVDRITASLSETDISAGHLTPNAGRAFQGPIPRGAGFVLKAVEAEGLLDRTEANYRKVIRPYLIGDDIANDPLQAPSRFIVDFGTMPLEEAMKYPAALDIVRERVKPARDADPVYADIWWMLWRPRPEMRKALSVLQRYIGGTATGKRILFAWCDPLTLPSNAMNVFAFDDEGSMGVLCSAVHHKWARLQSSTLEDRIRYTPTSAFETFPWPSGDVSEVGDAASRVIARRGEICIQQDIGLTQLYNQVDDGAWTDLRDLHRELDEAVALAYGWPRSVAHDPDETNRRLLELNRAIAAGEVAYDPFVRLQ